MRLPTRNCADIDYPYDNYNAAAYRSAGHTRIIMKATQGNGWVNPDLEKWAALSHRERLSVGFYHYAVPSANAVLVEVNHFLRYAQPLIRPGDILHLDLEEGLDVMGAHDLGTWASEFLLHLKNRTKQNPIPYMDESYYDALAGNIAVPGRQYWLAAYGDRAPRVRPRDVLWGWQFTNGEVGPFPHSATGIGRCDLSLLKRSQVLADTLRSLRRRRG